MRSVSRIVIIVAVTIGAASLAFAQDTASGDTNASLRQQIAELRQQLAATKLALDKTLAELESIKAFLSEKNLDQQIEQWRAERRDLEEERRRMMGERKKLEAARQMLHRTTNAQAEAEAKVTTDAAVAAEEALKPKWDVQYMIGLIDKEEEQIYLRVINGRVVRLRRFANIDTRNVMVRGTFANKSAAPWRYTFEIRIAGDASFSAAGTPGTPGIPAAGSALNGKWRYQTPVLNPGDLHEFEIKVPVRNAYDIETVQIVDVSADRPDAAAASPPVTP